MCIDVHISLRDIPDLLFPYLSLRSLSMIIASTSMPLDKILAHSFLWLRHVIVGVGKRLLVPSIVPRTFGCFASAECVNHAAVTVAVPVLFQNRSFLPEEAWSEKDQSCGIHCPLS